MKTNNSSNESKKNITNKFLEIFNDFFLRFLCIFNLLKHLKALKGVVKEIYKDFFKCKIFNPRHGTTSSCVLCLKHFFSMAWYFFCSYFSSIPMYVNLCHKTCYIDIYNQPLASISCMVGRSVQLFTNTFNS